MGGAGKAGKVSTSKVMFLIAGMLISGTLNTLTTKIQFTMYSVGLSGEEKQFRKPWYGTFNMMMAMALVLAVEKLVIGCCTSRRANTAGTAPLIDSENGNGCKPEDGLSYRQKVLMVSIPSAFDLFATALCCIGMLYIPASVWQMLRGASLIFAALLSITFLKREMWAFNWLGLFFCVVGITTVGIANVLGNNSNGSASAGETSDLVFGMVLVLAGQVVQAAQVIAEEFLMKDVDLPANQIVGFEGIWGVLMMVLLVYPTLYLLPGSDGGHAEDVFDTMTMVANSKPLLGMVVLYLFSCGTFNVTGIAITGALSAVHRMMLDASRTMVIWAFDLFVHYYVNPNSLFGEEWNAYSSLQLLGFLILVCGQAIYGEVLKVPGLQYPGPPAVDHAAWSSPGAMMLSSPLPRERSGSAQAA